uniref:F-box domain-containing protein n=1 Tax=Linum usitatissimum TaxID=4006 RepID=A0A165G0E8_LINUS|nr:hypothetical protein [Linum usitatissimum]
METAALFLISALAVVVTVFLLSPSLIVSFVPSFITKQRVTCPLDIVIDILFRLPVKTLIQFKCVSKHWNQILVSMHLMRSQQAPNRIICYYEIPNYYHMLNPPADQDQSKQFDYHLRNPATRQVQHLPEPPFEPPARHFDLPNHGELGFNDDFGVGLDLVSNVVKVVLIRYYCFAGIDGHAVSKFTSPVYVYTLDGGWRKLGVECPYPENWLSLDVWMLRSNYEEELCWIKDSTGIGPFPRELFVIGCWKDDLLVAGLVEDQENLVVYDMVKQEIKVVMPDVVVDRLFTYTETLSFLRSSHHLCNWLDLGVACTWQNSEKIEGGEFLYSGLPSAIGIGNEAPRISSDQHSGEDDGGQEALLAGRKVPL